MSSFIRNRVVVLLMLVALAGVASGVATVALTRPSAAELQGEQQAPWGLASFGESRTVDNFDSLGWALEEVGGSIFTGGNFLDVTNGAATRSQPYLAAFDVTTGAHDASFGPHVGGPVLALERADDGGLFVGGEMDTWNGQQVGAFVKIDPATGNLWPGWNTRIYGDTSVVRNISLEPDGWLYVVGTFSTASDDGTPKSVTNVVRMDPGTGDIDWTWLPQIPGGGAWQVNGGIWGVSTSRITDTVYFAGWFDVDGKPAIGLSTTDASVVTWDGFEMNYPCCGRMYDVEATEHGTVFFVGEQHAAYVYDENDSMALKISHVTSYDSRYQASTARRGGDYQRIERVGNRLYATCHCWGSHSSMNGPSVQPYSSDLALGPGTHTGTVSGVVAYNARTGAHVTTFAPYMAGDVGGWGVVGAPDGCLWMTGGFNAIGDPGAQRPGRDLVRLCDENHDVAAPVDPPASCTATISGDSVLVGWDGVDAAAAYVIYRSVDDGNVTWRGRTTAESFTDTNRDAVLVYSVKARNDAGDKSDAVTCATEVAVVPPEVPQGPASCTATVVEGVVTVEWPAVANAVEYVIYRNVDGGNQFWRGRTTELSFTDTNRAGVLTYYVGAKNQALERSERTECEPTAVEPPDPVGVSTVAACVSTPSVDGTQIEVGWDAADEIGAEYVVYRAVDGGNQFWRGRVTSLTFMDTGRDGTIEYYVAVKVGGQQSDRIACTTEPAADPGAD